MLIGRSVGQGKSVVDSSRCLGTKQGTTWCSKSRRKNNARRESEPCAVGGRGKRQFSFIRYILIIVICNCIMKFVNKSSFPAE